MCRIRMSISLAVGLAMAAVSVTATEPLVTEPRMVGDVDAGRLFVVDATAVDDDCVFLGARGRERLSLRWFDAEDERERKLAVVKSGEMPRALAPAGDGVIFTGFRDREGTEPWRSDGTRARTRLIREIHTGRQLANCAPATPCSTYPAGSDPSFFLSLDDHTYFAANHPRYGRELWRTNGTRVGTRLIRDIAAGPASGLGFSEATLVELEGTLNFVADDGRHGFELWRSDGTRSGTRMVRDIGPGWSVAWWQTPVVAGDHVYFTAERQAEGLELWRSDGTRKGTELVHDIRPGPQSSKPEDLTAVGDVLYFTARDREHGRELWRTDGSHEGTALVADLSPGPTPSVLGDLVALQDTLYFTTWDLSDEFGRPGELWRTDGTGEGTERVQLGADDPAVAEDPDAQRRNWSEFPTVATRDGRLYLTYDDGVHGNEVWMIDGATGDSALVADIRPGPKGSRPEWLTVAHSVLYLTAAGGEHGRQLWALPIDSPPEPATEEPTET